MQPGSPPQPSSQPQQPYGPYPQQYPPPYPYPQQPPVRPLPPPKGRSTAAIVVAIVVVIVVVVIAALVVLNFLRTSPASPTAQPNVNVVNTSATYSCPFLSSPYETFTFTLVNSGNANAYADVGFYVDSQLVTSNSYYAPAGSSNSYTQSVTLMSCPSSGSTYYIELLSVTPA